MAAIMVLAALFEQVAAGDEAEDEKALTLPPASALKPLARTYDESAESRGLAVKVQLVPDAYAYLMAAGMVKLGRARYSGDELDARLKELHREYQSEKGKILVRITLRDEGGSLANFFLQGDPEKHVELRQGSKKPISMRGKKPDPEFEGWQVFEQRRNEKRLIYKKALARIEKELVFSFAVRLKDGDKEPIKLAIGNLVRVDDRREEQRRDYRVFEGINKSTRQISTSNWKDQIVPPVKLTFYPGEWKAEELDPDVQAIFDWLEETG